MDPVEVEVRANIVCGPRETVVQAFGGARKAVLHPRRQVSRVGGRRWVAQQSESAAVRRWSLSAVRIASETFHGDVVVVRMRVVKEVGSQAPLPNLDLDRG